MPAVEHSSRPRSGEPSRKNRRPLAITVAALLFLLALILLAHKTPSTLTALLCAASFGMVMRFGANGLLLEPFVVFFVDAVSSSKCNTQSLGIGVF